MRQEGRKTENSREGFRILEANARDISASLSDICVLSELGVSDAAHLLMSAVSDDVASGLAWQDSLVLRYCSVHDSFAREHEARKSAGGVPDSAAFPLRVMMLVRLCRFIMELSKRYLGFEMKPDMLFFGDPDDVSDSARGRVSYFKNVYADEAFSSFSGIIKHPRAIYENSFEAACESVYGGESEFVILPFESLSEGRLLSFVFMAEKYELMTAAACYVGLGDGKDRTKFLLLRKNISVPEGDGNFTTEFVFYPSEDFPLSEFLLAGGYFGLSLIRADSLPGRERDDEYRSSVLFESSRDSVTGFILYLMLRRAGYSVSGMYRSVKGNRE